MKRLLTMAACAWVGLCAAPVLAQGPAAGCAPKPNAAAETRLAPGLKAGIHNAIINDVRLWYRVAGRGRPDAAPVVFLHGGPGSNSQGFATLVGPMLECSHRMVYFDQRGSGRSERPWTQNYKMDVLLSDIDGLRRELGVPKIALIGHSFGTILALEYAAKYPEHVSHVVLTASINDAPSTFRSGCERLKQVKPDAYAKAMAAPDRNGNCDLFGALNGKERETFFEANMFPNPAVRQRVNAAEQAGGLKNTGELSRAVFQSGLLDYRFDKGARMTMPVLVVSGGKDYQVGQEGPTALAGQLPRGRLLVYPDAGHFMYGDEPERFARDVTAFLANK